MNKYNYHSRKKVGLMLLMWLSLMCFFFSVSNYFQPAKYAFISALTDTLTLFFVYKVSLLFIFPRFYHHFRKYVVVSIAFVLLFSLIYYLIDCYFIPRAHSHVILKKPPPILNYIRIVMTNSFFYFVGTSVSLIEHNQRLVRREKLLTEEKLETELKLLKAQINPHFIFNALNNIYSLTYMHSLNAPEAVLKLSEMLRYVFYDCSKDRVRLSEEIKYIENFAAFQQMKSDFMQRIDLTAGEGLDHLEIAPMLFVPFVENAFKYSRIEEDESAFVNIRMDKDGGQLLFVIENSVPANNKPMPGSGTGIKNVQHRLSIIYPQRHRLEMQENADIFVVKLSIDV